jgi:hypothetical protein
MNFEQQKVAGLFTARSLTEEILSCRDGNFS